VPAQPEPVHGGERRGFGRAEHPRLPQFSATLRARIAHELREEILTGQIQAGATLGLDQLAAYFGSSRTPVREALIELEQDGLVKITPRSGIKVSSVSRSDLLDNFSLFAVLSGVAAEWASYRMTSERLQQITDLNARVELAVAERPDDLVLANWLFHREINLAAQSERLWSLLRRTSRVVPARFLELIPDQAEITAHDHRELLQALSSGDGGRARELAEKHVARAGELLAARLGLTSTEHAAEASEAVLGHQPGHDEVTTPSSAQGDTEP
jgi:DNA-binding GntR family transcriptional regulator